MVTEARGADLHLPDIEDEELVRRFQSGRAREHCFEELLERYGRATYAFFARRVGDPQRASDLNQELYLAVFQNLDAFRLESSFRTWLFRIARSALARLRRRWRVHLDELPVDLPRALWEELAVARGNPHDEIERKRTWLALKRCLARLQELERCVVVGQYVHGETLASLSERLGLTNRSGARAPLLSAQRKLRSCLESAGVAGGASS